MATNDEAFVLRSEDMPTLRSPRSLTLDEARRTKPPGNVLCVTAEVLDPPQPIKRQEG